MPTGVYPHKPRTEEWKRNISRKLKGRKKPPRTEEHIKNFIKSRTGKNVGSDNPEWRGEFASKGPIHRWVSRWKGTPRLCEACGKTDSKKFEWANVDHRYRRVLDDYIRMCTSCHRKYDIKNNGYKSLKK